MPPRACALQGMDLFQRERYAEAIQLFDQSLGINERYMAPGALGLCTNLNNLASAYDKLNQKATAIYFYERAVGVLNHPSAVWDEQRRRARDHVMGKLSRMVRDESDSADDSAQFALAQRVASAMWEEVRPRAAGCGAQRARPRRACGSRPRVPRPALVAQGLKLYASDRAADALVLFQQVLTFNRKYRPHDSAVLATTINNIGAAHEKCGEYTEAMAYFRAAADALERSSVPGKAAKIAHVHKRLAALSEKAAAAAGGVPLGAADSAKASASTLAQSPPEASPPPPQSQPAASPPDAGGPHSAPRAGAPPAVHIAPARPSAPPVRAREARTEAAALALAGDGDPPLSNDREVAE